jgi:hypothetical protein
LLSMTWFKVCIRISYMSITYRLLCPLSRRPFPYVVFSSLPRLRHQVFNYCMWDERRLRPLLHSFLIHIRTIRNLLTLPMILILRFNLLQNRFIFITAQHDPQRRLPHHRKLIHRLCPLLRIPPRCVPCLSPIVFLASICSHIGCLVSANFMLRPAQAVLNPPGSRHVSLIPHSGFSSCGTASLNPSAARFDAQ